MLLVVTWACMYCQKLWSYGEEIAVTKQRIEGSSYGVVSVKRKE